MTSILSVDNLEFKNGSNDSLVKCTATADVLTFSSLNGNVELKGVKDPSQAQSVATKNYVDSVSLGLVWLEPCRAATDGSITLATDVDSGKTLDGVVLATGDRILVKDQGSLEDGIYIVAASGAPSRSADCAIGDEMSGHAVFVKEGTNNADQGYVCTSDEGSDVVGTDILNFSQFTALGQITAGDALSKTGNTLNVNVDDSSIEVSGDALQVKASGVSNAMLANSNISVVAGNALATTSESISLGSSATLSVNVDDSSIEVATDALQVKALGITNAMLAGSIANSKLSNSSVDVAISTGLTTTSQNIALGGSATLGIDFAEVVRTSTNQSIAGVKSFTDTTQSTASTNGAVVLSGGMGVAKDVRCSGSVYAVSHISTSDEKRKKDIKPLTSVDNEIKALEPVEYKWIEGDDHLKAGLIAQHCKKVVPQAVYQDKDGFLSIDYNHVFSMLLKSHQDLLKRVEELENK